MSDEHYRQLVEAVRAYDNALRLYGAMSTGEQWLNEVPELDELWDRVLVAAGLKEASR